MRKRLMIGLLTSGLAAAMVAAPVTVSADPPGGINGHNCAGVIVSALAGPGFGQLVKGAAQEQVVDNFGFANCFQVNRNNP